MNNKLTPPADVDKATAVVPATASAEMVSARALTGGLISSTVVRTYLPASSGPDEVALAAAVKEQAAAVGAGDMSPIEELLLAQSAALTAMFVDLANRARKQSQPTSAQAMTALALKAAAGARQALVAAAELRVPRMTVIAKQANMTSAALQVNNNPPLPAAVDHVSDDALPRPREKQRQTRRSN